MRKLTKKFTSYTLGQYEKKTGKGVMDLLDVGNLEINKIANLIRLGNSDFKDDEEAYARLDEYLASDEENSLITAFFDLLDEMDRDLKIMKSCGVKVASIKEQFKREVEGNIKEISFKTKNRLTEQAENTGEAVDTTTLKDAVANVPKSDNPGLTAVK